MAHRFTRDSRGWGAREFLAFDDAGDASEDTADLLVEVTFHRCPREAAAEVEEEEEEEEESKEEEEEEEERESTARASGARTAPGPGGSRGRTAPRSSASLSSGCDAVSRPRGGPGPTHQLPPARGGVSGASPGASPGASRRASSCRGGDDPSRAYASPLGALPGATARLVSESPLLMVFDDFLGAKECEDLMSVAAADLRRSRVTDGKLSDGRTSSSTFLTGAKRDVAVVRAVERRVLSAARLAGLVAEERAGAEGHERARLAGAEPMQVVRYDRGQMYTAHYDNKQGCVRRAATFMMYLTDVDAGGATHFPKAVPRGEERRRPQKSPASASVEDPDATTPESPGRGGVRVWPKRGRALVFWSVRGGAEDARSLHEAEPVVEGEKWIATKWLQVEDAARPGAASDARGARAVFG